MHTKLERLLWKSLTTLEVMAYYLVVHTGPGVQPDVDWGVVQRACPGVQPDVDVGVEQRAERPAQGRDNQPTVSTWPPASGHFTTATGDLCSALA